MAAVDFDRFDVNRDNRISRFEFDNVAHGIGADVERDPKPRVAHRLRPWHLRKAEPQAGKTSRAGKAGISKASASSSRPIRDTRRRSGT